METIDFSKVITHDATPEAYSMVQTFRSYGYNLETAMSDIIDNAISAKAKMGGLPDSFSMEPPKIENNLKMADFLDLNPAQSLYLSDAQIAHLKEKHNIPSFVVDTPLCFDVYNKKIKSDGYSITITQPEHNSLRVVEVPKSDGKERVRKMSIHEQYRLMGFDISRDCARCEINFNDQSYTQLSKRAGNGWDINVVTQLLLYIFKQL